MTKYYLLVGISILYISSSTAQSNDTEAALYNVGFGAVFSTVGAIINKDSDVPMGKVITKSLWQGALGGYITFESKRILREAVRQDEWGYFWVAKLVNAAGTSIKENAALNDDFYDRWHINIGFNRVEFNTKDKFSVNYRLMPISFGYVIDAFFRYDFEVESTLKIGEFMFSTDKDLGSNPFFEVSAASNPGYIVTKSNFIDLIDLQAHEVIHKYQFNDFTIFNTYLDQVNFKFWNKSNTLDFINRHLYIEYHFAISRPLYILERETSNDSYYDNFFEHEAEYFSRGF